VSELPLKMHPEVVRKDGKVRFGRGFSRDELKEAGVDSKQALRLTIPVDLRRKTKHEENVKVLKQHLGLQVRQVPKISKPPEPSKKPSKPKKAKVTEPELAKPAKPIKRKKTTEIKPKKRAKAEKTAPKKLSTKRKAAKSKSEEKT